MHYARFKGEAQRDRTAFGRGKTDLFAALSEEEENRDRIVS